RPLELPTMRPGGKDTRLPADRTNAAYLQDNALPISLPVALRLALAANLEIAKAREVIDVARAALLRARATVLPTFTLGSTYSSHEGTIQKTEGNIIIVNRDSLFVGGGPQLVFQTTDALFGPAIARQVEVATQAGLQRVTLDTLFAVADAYFNVLRARRRLARVESTLEFLTQERIRLGPDRFKGLFPLLRDFVAAGAMEAWRADLERVRVEILRREE